MIKNKELKVVLKKYLIDKKRIIHSISTANFMEKNARIFNIDKNKAYTAGFLHDLAKDLKDDKLINLSESFMKRNIIKINYFDFKKEHPFLLHGVASSELIIRELSIYDKDLLEAVCAHTLGGEKISKLAMFTFISDFCEPRRNYVHAKVVQRMLIKEKKFNKAYFYSYFFLLYNLIRKQKEICPESIEGYNKAHKLYYKK